ncbi:MAG: right-handed parallel beta-helix repeat-containing protein [Actinomycetota bacterium]|nr:right-handed parallel beta-helix repeat-containing protein [Actinomycetota bacterium]
MTFSLKTRLASTLAIAMLTSTLPLLVAQSATAASCSGVQVNAGSSSLQAAIDSHGNNTTFCLGNGTYNISNTLRPKPADSFIGTGATRDSATIKTSSAQIVFAAATNNVFRRVAITGAVNACPGKNCGATGMGINGGSNLTLDNVHLYNNGRSGIGGSGDGLLITNSEVDHNGAQTGDGVSSGIKSVHTLTVTNSYIHDNKNSGIWCDISCGSYNVTGNKVTHQTGSGIFMEISQGQAVLANNVVKHNNTSRGRARGGILVTSSMNVKIYGNRLSGNHSFGIGARSDHRAGSCGTPDASCGYALSNISVHNNNLGGDSLRGCALHGVKCESAGSATDSNHTAGRLDIARLNARGSRHGTGHFKIATQRRFRCQTLKLSKPNHLKLLFDDRRDGDADLVGRFFCSKGSSRNHWFLRLHGPSTGSHYEALRATRPNRHTLKVTVPLDLREFKGTHMGVFARSKDAACNPNACRDRAPHNGSLKVY